MFTRICDMPVCKSASVAIQALARGLSTAIVGLVALTPGHSALAQTSDAVAESLFRDGKSYFQAEDFEHACPKFAQSYQVDPAGGTVLLLAICYEKQGRFASAWARYNDALAIAKRDGREDRERRAREGLEAVEPKLSYIKLTLDSATQTIPGIALSIDGTELPVMSDTPLPVDCGTHKLLIRAPKYETWQTEVKVTESTEIQSITVPGLQSTPAAPIPAEPPASIAVVPQTVTSNATVFPERVDNARVRRSAYVIGGAGLAAVALGSYFGVRAIQLNNEANRICPTSQCSGNQVGAIAKTDEASSKARIADLAIGVGSAAVISAAVLWYVYRRDPPSVIACANPTTRAISVNWQQSF